MGQLLLLVPVLTFPAQLLLMAEELMIRWVVAV